MMMPCSIVNVLLSALGLRSKLCNVCNLYCTVDTTISCIRVCQCHHCARQRAAPGQPLVNQLALCGPAAPPLCRLGLPDWEPHKGLQLCSVCLAHDLSPFESNHITNTLYCIYYCDCGDYSTSECESVCMCAKCVTHTFDLAQISITAKRLLFDS